MRNTGNALMKLGLLWRLISPKFSSKLQEVTREAFRVLLLDADEAELWLGISCIFDAILTDLGHLAGLF